jgi:hypothetical protein
MEQNPAETTSHSATQEISLILLLHYHINLLKATGYVMHQLV